MDSAGLDTAWLVYATVPGEAASNAVHRIRGGWTIRRVGIDLDQEPAGLLAAVDGLAARMMAASVQKVG